MIFTDIRFALLLAGCWVSFFAVPRHLRPAVLAAWGVAFYGIYAGRFLPLVAALVLAAYVMSGRRWSGVFVAAIVLLFVGFKLKIDPTGVVDASGSARGALLMPLGLSFLVFELLHFVIERQRGRVADASLVALAGYAFFFPCRIAGPIRRYPEFMAAVESAEASAENVYAGIVRVLTGLFKKIVLADVLAPTVEEISYASTPLHVWKVVLVFSLQIFLDFSAYSDLAIGTSRMLGVHAPENFNRPYLSRNIQEFWTRWHITLSAWARDYVFSPLGRTLFKTRLRSSPTLIAVLSYVATFLVIGAWHGLTPNFLAWGAYHGLLLSAYYVYRKWLPAAVVQSSLFQSPAATAAGVGLTFLLVTIGWVPFISDLGRSSTLLRLMLGGL